MGCCEARHDKKDLITRGIEKKYQSFAKQALSMGIANLSKINDPKAEDIIYYVIGLENRNDWTPIITEEEFKAVKIDSSKYNKNIMVSQIELALDFSIPLYILLDLMLKFEERKKWDEILQSLTVLEGDSYCHLICRRLKVLLYAAEFIDRQIVAKDDNSVYIISYSIDSDHIPLNKSYTRGDNILSVFQITEVNGKTRLKLTNQTDPKNFFASLAPTIGIMKQKMWIYMLKKMILKQLGY